MDKLRIIMDNLRELIGFLVAFRPTNPRTWMRLPRIVALMLINYVIYLNKLVGAQQYVLLQVSTIALIALKCKSLIDERLERHKIFDKCNIPSVSGKNVFSGNLFEMIVPVNNIKIQEDYHKRLGKTYGIFYGPDPWVLTIDMDLLHKVFVVEGQKHVDMNQLRMPFMNEINSSLAQVGGDTWRRHRKTLDPFFSLRSMKKDNVHEDILASCDKFIEMIQAHPKNDEGRKVVDVNDAFKRLSIQVIFQVAYGIENGVNMTPFGKNKLIDLINMSANEIRGPIVWASIMLDNASRLLGHLTRFTVLAESKDFIHAVLDESIKARRAIQHKIDRSQRKLIDTLIECMDSNKMDSEAIQCNLFFLFLAGFETTANTLVFLFFFLAKHERVQKKLRESIIVDSEKSQYLDWCIQETLRLYPAVPSAVGRNLSEDIEWKGITLKKGMSLVASIYTIHRWKEYWGPDVEEFRPERFGEIKLHPAQYFAFGIGPRYCIGTNLALAELKTIASKLLLRYHIFRGVDLADELPSISPNMIHFILEGQINLQFEEIKSL